MDRSGGTIFRLAFLFTSLGLLIGGFVVGLLVNAPGWMWAVNMIGVLCLVAFFCFAIFKAGWDAGRLSLSVEHRQQVVRELTESFDRGRELGRLESGLSSRK